MDEHNFTFKKVDPQDEKLLNEVYALRYQVYCHECGFLSPKDYPNGIETDEYDQQSVHFVALDEEGVIGTMRMILPGRLPFPIEKHCGITIEKNVLPDIQYAEMSRLVITKRMRRRKNDQLYYEPQIEDQKFTDEQNNQFMRRAKPMAFGMYKEMYHESKRTGISHWYTLMEKSLWLLLRIHGFNFECIGDEVDVYGPVKPYLGKIDVIEQEVAKKFPKFFTYFTSDVESSQ